MDKFNNGIIQYRSGDGESFVEKFIPKDGKAEELTEEETEWLEREYHDIVWEHDHANESAYGYITIENGKIIKHIYDASSY